MVPQEMSKYKHPYFHVWRTWNKQCLSVLLSFLAPIILNKLASAKHKSNVYMTLAFHSDSIWPPLHLQLLTELSNSNLTKGRWRWMSLSSTSREECRFGTSCLISSRINIGTQESRERKTTSTWHGRTVIATHTEV